MLLSRYSNIEFVMELPVKDGLKLITKAFEERNNERLYERWIQGYDKSISFNEFKKELQEVKVDKIDKSLTEEEIMEDVEDILNQFRG